MLPLFGSFSAAMKRSPCKKLMASGINREDSATYCKSSLISDSMQCTLPQNKRHQKGFTLCFTGKRVYTSYFTMH